MFKNWPLPVRLTFIILLLLMLFFIIYIGQGILLPLSFSFLLAVLLQPIQQLCMRYNIHRVIAILISMFLALIVIAGVFMFMYNQLSSFMSDIPTLKKNLMDFYAKIQLWVNTTFHISKEQQQELIDKTKQDTVQNAGVVAGSAIGFISASFASLIVIPVYVFLFMFYSNHLKNFILQLFQHKHLAQVSHALGQIRNVIQKYLTGLLIETSCVAVLNSIGLLLLGIPYAILLGVFGAILNLIPYIGGLIAVFLTALITLTNTGDVYKMLGSFIVYLVVQFIDNNFFVPRIIGSHVKLNALISLVAVLVGGAVAGVGGMFLSIPFIAIAKVIFDHVEDLKPWGMLLGDEENAGWRLNIKPTRKVEETK